MEGKIKVSKNVFKGLKVVRESGQTNMFDATAVVRLLKVFDYPEAAEWVKNNKGEYSKGIFTGFEIDQEH